MAHRIVQDLKVCRSYRPPAPAWLKLAYFASVLAVVGSLGRIGYEYFHTNHARAAAAENRNLLQAARRIGLSRKEWIDNRPRAAAIQLALIRTIQEAGLELKTKKESLSNTPVQMKSMKMAWVPRQDKIPAMAKVDLALSSSAPKPAALRELNRSLARAAESLNLVVTSPRWGDAPGGVLTLSVELKETLQ